MPSAEGAAAFSASGSAYDRYMGRYSVPLAARLADAARVGQGQRALEVGCGPGALTAELALRLGAENVNAIDPSEPFVEECRSRNPGVDVRIGAAESLPFPDASFDAALAQLAFQFMHEPERGAAEMRRVLRPGCAVAG